MSITNMETKFTELKRVYSLNQSTSFVPHANNIIEFYVLPGQKRRSCKRAWVWLSSKVFHKKIGHALTLINKSVSIRTIVLRKKC